MANQIMIIAPYWVDDLAAWVFDDAKVGLVQEPFVSGVPEMIDFLVKDIPNARNGFRMFFSPAPFPGYQKKLVWRREVMGGNWYATDDPPMEGWLCPALFRYFDTAPAEAKTKIERRERRPIPVGAGVLTPLQEARLYHEFTQQINPATGKNRKLAEIARLLNVPYYRVRNFHALMMPYKAS